MEGLLELVRAEQNIYNIVFHEVIRQVTVSCAERGQLLEKLRSAGRVFKYWCYVVLPLKHCDIEKPVRVSKKAFFSQQPFVFVSLESATSRCLIESLGVWRLCTLSQWHSELWTAAWLKRSTTTSRPSSTSVCRCRCWWPLTSFTLLVSRCSALVCVFFSGPPSQWAVQNPREQFCGFPGGRPRSPAAHCGPAADSHQLRVRSQLLLNKSHDTFKPPSSLNRNLGLFVKN